MNTFSGQASRPKLTAKNSLSLLLLFAHRERFKCARPELQKLMPARATGLSVHAQSGFWGSLKKEELCREQNSEDSSCGH